MLGSRAWEDVARCYTPVHKVTEGQARRTAVSGFFRASTRTRTSPTRTTLRSAAYRYGTSNTSGESVSKSAFECLRTQTARVRAINPTRYPLASSGNTLARLASRVPGSSAHAPRPVGAILGVGGRRPPLARRGRSRLPGARRPAARAGGVRGDAHAPGVINGLGI